jgi:RimJ/RimL family protein N-acetyltransferase
MESNLETIIDAGDLPALSTMVALRDGGRVRIRAIRPDDKELLLDHFRRLSPASVYWRFFTPKKSLPPAELRTLTELDSRTAVGLAATTGEGADERFLGVGRYFASSEDVTRAEVAFAVADEHQGRGIATELLRALVPVARRQGIRILEADVLAENVHMIHVLTRMGFVVQPSLHPSIVKLAMQTDR